jgi:hypothetical protein
MHGIGINSEVSGELKVGEWDEGKWLRWLGQEEIKTLIKMQLEKHSKNFKLNIK